ncbi:MAG: PH domain-containing protein [Propionibacterium sp.]|nr:PH domain-containing protein [Propionibacterium sp.]
MAFNEKNLGEGEEMILRLRTHAKVLIWPAIILILLGAAVGAGLAFMPPDWNPIGTWVLVGVAVILFIWLVALPWLRWWTSQFAVTDRRIITRHGIINRKGHDVPLRRINNVNYDRDVIDRLLGCGTLTLETAAGQPLVLPDVPDVERVHVQITDLLFQMGPDGDGRGE